MESAAWMVIRSTDAMVLGKNDLGAGDGEPQVVAEVLDDDLGAAIDDGGDQPEHDRRQQPEERGARDR